MPTVEIVANFCEFIRMISDKEGNKISELAMEPLFAGEKARTRMLIVNNTPKACEYRVIRKKGQVGEEASSLVTPEEIGRDDSEKLISFSPSQGEIEAYSAVEFTADIQSKFD